MLYVKKNAYTEIQVLHITVNCNKGKQITQPNAKCVLATVRINFKTMLYKYLQYRFLFLFLFSCSSSQSLYCYAFKPLSQQHWLLMNVLLYKKKMIPLFYCWPAKTSISPCSSPLGTFRAKRQKRRRARRNGCFRRLFYCINCFRFYCLGQVKLMCIHNGLVHFYFLIITGVTLPQLSISRTPL